jgi:phosphopantothenoylcysteine synthetase/decarboxylase
MKAPPAPGRPGCLDWIMTPLCQLVLCGAPLTALAPSVAKALLDADLRVKVAATPAAGQWVDEAALHDVVGHRCLTSYTDETAAKESGLDGYPDVVAVVPMTFNTLNKLANGIADGYVPTHLCLALGRGTPIITVPMFSTNLADHPVTATSMRFLRQAGVQFIDPLTGDMDVRPFQPGQDDAIVEGFDPAWVVARVQQALVSVGVHPLTP